MSFKKLLRNVDPEISEAIYLEIVRLETELQLIPSENVLDDAIMQAQGSVLTTKYAEGYPGKRYYGGCQYIDVVEDLARERVKKLFGCKFANVQPHSGSSANFSIMYALLRTGETILGLSLETGGHLTHGHPLNFSGKLFNAQHYGVDKDTEMLDYDKIFDLAKKVNPKIIICGATAYPRSIDFSKFREIADAVGALVMADISHIAGLIVAGEHVSSVPFADVTMSTTHKTLGGPRGGIIITNREDVAKAIDKSIIPGTQGGPLMNEIAGKAVALKLAMTEEFKEEQRQIVRNAKALAAELTKYVRIVSGGTDNHLLLADVTSIGLSGSEAETALSKAGITVNKNTIPFDRRKPLDPSGIRLGAVIPTRRGMKEREMEQIATFIGSALTKAKDCKHLSEIRSSVRALCEQFPYYSHLASDYRVDSMNTDVAAQ